MDENCSINNNFVYDFKGETSYELEDIEKALESADKKPNDVETNGEISVQTDRKSPVERVQTPPPANVTRKESVEGHRVIIDVGKGLVNNVGLIQTPKQPETPPQTPKQPQTPPQTPKQPEPSQQEMETQEVKVLVKDDDDDDEDNKSTSNSEQSDSITINGQAVPSSGLILVNGYLKQVPSNTAEESEHIPQTDLDTFETKVVKDSTNRKSAVTDDDSKSDSGSVATVDSLEDSRRESEKAPKIQNRSRVSVYCKTQNIHPTLSSPTCKDLVFRPVLISHSYNIEYTFDIRMFIHSCFEFTHYQLGETSTMANKSHSTVYLSDYRTGILLPFQH